ncbi:MAG: gluconeogenesis factor YvcK family protein [Coriobacteriia bacterium]
MSVGVGRRAVAIGGGTGLPAVIHSLLALGFDTSAVVTMADDGGSSGLLRRQLGMLPPGDIRNCLVAMAADEDGQAARLFQYRFPQGEGLSGHALGNLILAALADLTGSFPAAIEHAEDYLGARGHVYPSTLSDVELHGVDRAGDLLSGQARLAVSPEPLECVHLEPANPPAYEPALEAIRSADVIVVGPGSLYTSLIPNFLVAGIAEAVSDSSALRVYVCNVANMRGETGGLDAADHVAAFTDHGLVGALDVVLVHDPCASGSALCDDVAGVEPVFLDADVIARIEVMGPRVVAAALADPADPVRHSRAALLRTLEGVVA